MTASQQSCTAGHTKAISAVLVAVAIRRLNTFINLLLNNKSNESISSSFQPQLLPPVCQGFDRWHPPRCPTVQLNIHVPYFRIALRNYATERICIIHLSNFNLLSVICSYNNTMVGKLLIALCNFGICDQLSAHIIGGRGHGDIVFCGRWFSSC